MHVQINKLGSVNIYEANEEMTAVSTFELQFWVEKTDGTKEKAATLSLIDTDLGFTSTVNDMKLQIGLTQMNVKNVNVVDCTFGRLSAILIRTEINNGFRLFQSSINNFLAKKLIPMPRNILGVFELTALTLGYYDSYLYVGYTPVFKPLGTEAVAF